MIEQSSLLPVPTVASVIMALKHVLSDTPYKRTTNVGSEFINILVFDDVYECHSNFSRQKPPVTGAI